MLKRFVLVLLFVALLASVSSGQATPAPRSGPRIILATTTSLEDSGLLNFILPNFTHKTGIRVDAVVVGTGQAMEIGAAGDADVVLVHDRKREDAFVADGNAVERFDVMFNDFVIVGPGADPAGVADVEDVAEAMRLIAQARATFVSRGDDSGTHNREKSLWDAAGVTPEGDWYISVGQGMGAVLTMSDELQAYTLVDRATYAARLAQGLSLQILVEGDARLLNPYSVLVVNPAKHTAVNAEAARAFVDWLLSVETQELIAQFSIEGQQVFFPQSAAYLAAQPAARPESNANA